MTSFMDQTDGFCTGDAVLETGGQTLSEMCHCRLIPGLFILEIFKLFKQLGGLGYFFLL